jgi:hypothetical protein
MDHTQVRKSPRRGGVNMLKMRLHTNTLIASEPTEWRSSYMVRISILRCTVYHNAPPCFRLIERRSNALTASRALPSLFTHIPIAASICRPLPIRSGLERGSGARQKARRSRQGRERALDRLFRLHSSPLALIGFGLVEAT